MEKNKKTIDLFCGQKNGYSRSITLRNRLIPVGKTQENIEKSRILESDSKRADAYPEIKNLIDDFHRSFIQDVLSKTKLEWAPLYDEFDLYQKETDKIKKDAIKKELQKLQEVMRKQIVKKFTNDDRFKKLFAKELLTDLLPAIIENAPADTITDKKNALSVFNKFSTYFTGFHENRKNMYSDEEKSTAISYRLVNENFPKFYANVRLFQKLEKDFPQIIIDCEESLKAFLKGKKLRDIFNEEAYNNVLSQSGIDFYNTVIGGITAEAGNEKNQEIKEKIQGINEKINLARQQLPQEEKNKLRGKMTVLFKQILSDKETFSFIPAGFESNEEVYTSVRSFSTISVKPVVEEIKKHFESRQEFNFDEIYVPSKELTAFSSAVYGSWSILSEGMLLLEKDSFSKELSETQINKITIEISKRDYSVAELQSAYERWCKEKSNKPVTKTYLTYFDLLESRTVEGMTEKSNVSVISNIDDLYNKIDFDLIKDLQLEKEAATPIKDYLDEVVSLYHFLKLVDYRGEEEKDSNFYSKYEELLLKISDIIPLYNKVRNFVTKKPGEVKKIKLNFDCPTLANGWDENKESANDAIILRRNGLYYLGIFNSKDKPKFEKENVCTGDYYEKVVYKLLPGPNKMLPKVFFSTKGRETFMPPEELLLGYKEGKHKKGENFDKEFMFRLIDWFKDAINRHEDWKKFGFVFSDTKSYEDISGFYKEVELQGYKITFQNVPVSKIDEFVDSGKLFLFQIYNKDFAEKASGKKNMHTLYWENLFSKENLKDVCYKLNGEAELFFRPASFEKSKVTVHKKGSELVNRTTSDNKSIPENLYQEIYQFKNGMRNEISAEAKELLDSGVVVTKKATHDITKDRRFTHETYLFHCPITMNFKAPEITGRKFNDRVLEVLKNNPDVKIIGLDRGERNLLYLSLINQKGEIELQKSMNIVKPVRNDKPVEINYQEKLVQKEGERDNARKNWQTIGNIKELKEGYLSNVVHEIAELMVENNAIVVMEDLNFGFKRGRFAVERQVYQKFENMLIDKLNYLIFKDKKDSLEKGGVLNAYQLTDKAANVSDVYKQCGWLFYIPAAYTSKIDPKTGFSNLFVTKGLTNVEKKKEFFCKFDSIYYDKQTESFAFEFDYGKLCNNADYLKKWTVYSRGERIVYKKEEKKAVTIDPTNDLSANFTEFGIDWRNENNLIPAISEIEAEKNNAKFFDGLLRSFNAVLQMRNSIPNSEIDYLISPVKADDGTFFDSRIELEKENKGEKPKLPKDADANGAYHIALKGLFLLTNNFNRNDKGVIQGISNADWFKFVQKKEYLN